MTISNMSYRTLIFLLAILLFFAGCANNNHGKPEDSVYSGSPIIGLVWDTRGGGDMRFAVEREGEDYKITVERYNFHTINRVIALTGGNDEAYRLVDDIFEKRVDLCSYTFIPKGLTGTWTEITLRHADSRETAIDRIDAVGGLSVLYQFVHDVVQDL